MRKSQNLDFLGESISIFLSRSLFFLFYWQFCCPLYRLPFAWNCSWLTFWERDKCNFQGVVCKQRNWQRVSMGLISDWRKTAKTLVEAVKIEKFNRGKNELTVKEIVS